MLGQLEGSKIGFENSKFQTSERSRGLLHGKSEPWTILGLLHRNPEAETGNLPLGDYLP